jgi:hypothetical protein
MNSQYNKINNAFHTFMDGETIKNTSLNQELEVTTSIKAPVHYVDTIPLTKTVTGNLNIDVPEVECTQVTALIGSFSGTVSTASLLPASGLGGVIDVDGDLDLKSTGSLLNLDKLTLASGAPVAAGYVLSSDVDGTLAWIPDAAGDVSQWSTYNAVSDVNLGSNNLNCSKSISDDVWTSYISLPKDGSSSSMYLNSFTNTAKIPNLLVDSLDTTDPFSTQINLNKNLNLSSHIIYASTGNFGTSINSLNTFLGVEPNRWSGGEVYTLQQLDGDNAVRSISGADFTGFHDIESKRGKFYTTNELNEEKFTANELGQVVCEELTTKNIIIPLSTPAAGDVIKSDGSGAIYWASDTNTPADWSQYVATQTVDINSNDITNVKDIYAKSISSYPSGTLLNVDGIKMTRRLELDGKDLYFETASNPFSRVYTSSFGSEVYSQQLKLRNRDGKPSDNVAIEMYNTSGNNVFRVNAPTNLLNSNTALKVEGLGTVQCAQLIPTYKAERVLWVSGNNTYATKNGSYENPFITIQEAVTFAESNYANEYWYINVLPGTYAGFTVTKKLFIKGVSSSNPDACSVGCQINSDIIINLDSNDGDMFNNSFGLSGFLIAGCKLVDSSSARHVLNITDCYFYNDSGTGRSIDCRPSSTDCRLQIFNSKIVNVSPSGGDPMVEISVGMAKFFQSQFQCAGVQNCVKFSGTSRVDSVVLCSFTSTNASATIPPIIELTTTSTSPFSFSNCAFIYTSTTNKTASPSSCAIYGNSATTPAVITVLYNTFSLAGTSDPQNHVINYNTVPSISFFFSNCATPNTCFRINGTHTTLQAVV